MSNPKNLDNLDTGAETLKRFRYQITYGVMLWIAIYTDKLPYLSLYCEFHDDFLCSRTDGKFDAIQVKTRSAAYGSWLMTDSAFIKSVARWVEMDLQSPGYFDRFVFVSNMPMHDTKSKKETELARSPIVVCSRCRSAGPIGPLESWLDNAVSKLAKSACVPFENARRILSISKFQRGPSQDDIDTVVAHEHVPTLPGCTNHKPSMLNSLRDELVSDLFRASSLSNPHPIRHYEALASPAQPTIVQAKTRDGNDLERVISDSQPAPFRFRGGRFSVALDNNRTATPRLAEKLNKAGLVNHVESLELRALETERTLLEHAALQPKLAVERSSRIADVVKVICDDALLLHEDDPPPYGRAMYRTAQKLLQNYADKHGIQENSNMLLGMAGLLTEECKVWWGPKFQLHSPQDKQDGT